MGLFKKEVKQAVELTEEELRKWMVKRASPRLSRPIKDSDFLDLVDELLFVIEDIPEKLLEKIGKVLGERWICWGDMDEW